MRRRCSPSSCSSCRSPAPRPPRPTTVARAARAGSSSSRSPRSDDLADYFLAPDGDFSAGGAGWDLAGATVVDENEPWNVHGGETPPP